MDSIAQLLNDTAARRGDAIALVDGDRQRSYDEFAGLVDRLARALVALGLERHDRVAIFLDKSIEVAVSIFACSAAGLIAVPINPKLKPAQVRHILTDCTAAALVTTPFRLKQLAGSVETAALHVILTAALDVAGIASRSSHLWWEVAADHSEGKGLHRTIDIDPTAILYTSGSTGMPKGVTISQRNLVAGARSVNAYLGTSRDDTILSLLPLSFDAGLSQLTTAVEAGAKLVLHNHLRAQEVAAICLREQVTSITGVPPLWNQLAAVPWEQEARLPVRIFANTGGHMPAALLARLRVLFPKATPFLMYGLTEAFRSTYLDPAEIDRRPGSIGKAIPNAEILILDPEGKPCGPDEPGELVHRGALVTLGYWNDPVRTAERFRPLELRPAAGLVPEMAVWSGDIVKRDAEGFITFVGRRDEMLKSSGYRISPTEIESVLHEAPGVKEAAVFGIPDPELGQAIVAALVPVDGTLDLAQVAAFCGRQLPAYMVPRLVALEELPRSPNGKIDRTGLPALCAERGLIPARVGKQL